jgi:uncharacterized protein YpuA (DUF1002 family)
MGRPTKPLGLIEGHRTKDELQIRRDAEKALLTGEPMKIAKETRNNKVASAEFRRIKELLGKIGKDDDLYSQIINMHCVLVAECQQIQDIRDQFINSKEELQEDYHDQEKNIEASDYYRMLTKISDNIINCDKQLMVKRKMILDISKENIMTVQSALRSIPKKPEKKEGKSGMAAFMAKRAEGK